MGRGLGDPADFVPGTAGVLDKASTARISWPIAVLIWLMIYPMMLKIDFKSILQAGKKPKGVVVTTVSNWLVKPFTMYLFASLFFLILFKPWINHALGKQYLAGTILLGPRRAPPWCSSGATSPTATRRIRSYRSR